MTTIRCSPTAYAVVLPPPDGRAILRDPRLVRYAYGLWPAGLPGEVVGLIVDAGTGTTEADIRSALTVHVLGEEIFADAVRGSALDHAWCELDRLRADAERLASEEDPLHGYSPDEIVVGPGGQTLSDATKR